MGPTAKWTGIIFGIFVALVLGGLGWLAEANGSAAYSASFVSSMWLIWLFVLWGALVAAVVFMIAWLAETFEREPAAGH